MEYSLAMPTIRPFFASRSFSFTTGIIPKHSFCSRSNLAVSDRMKSSVFRLRPYPGARQQSEQFRRQSVEQALDDATQFVGFFWADEPVGQPPSVLPRRAPHGAVTGIDPR